jgi:hypothetical protein
MFDDGNHGDNEANDGVYGCYIPPHNQGVRIRYYIEATSTDSAKTKTYHPARAEQDVFTYIVQ